MIYLYPKGYNMVPFFITGIITNADYSSTIGYKDKEIYKKDYKAWKLWLVKNKCKLTNSYIDIAMKQVKK